MNSIPHRTSAVLCVCDGSGPFSTITSDLSGVRVNPEVLGEGKKTFEWNQEFMNVTVDSQPLEYFWLDETYFYSLNFFPLSSLISPAPCVFIRKILVEGISIVFWFSNNSISGIDFNWRVYTQEILKAELSMGPETLGLWVPPLCEDKKDTLLMLWGVMEVCTV